jgi:heptosyltransferase-2
VSRILVIAPNWIGDALMAQPLLALLRERRPGLKIDVLAPPWVAPVARRMPEVDEVITAPFRHGGLQLGERWRLGRSLKDRYDEAIVLPNSWKSALLPFFAGISKRTGYVGEARYGLLNDRHGNPERLMRRHYARLAGEASEPLPRPHLKIDAAGIERVRKRFELPARYAVLCPGAEYGPAKRWPFFAELADRVGMPAVLLGSANDAAAAAGIAGINLAGQTSLDEAMDVIAGAQVVVSNDSGLMHVAAALGRPLVALYGSSSPEMTPPQAGKVLWLRVECSPCYQRECPLGHFRCMREMSVDRVLKEMEKP